MVYNSRLNDFEKLHNLSVSQLSLRKMLIFLFVLQDWCVNLEENTWDKSWCVVNTEYMLTVVSYPVSEIELKWVPVEWEWEYEERGKVPVRVEPRSTYLRD